MKTGKQRGGKVEAWAARLAPPVRDLVRHLRELVAGAAPEAVEEFKWGNPCYVLDGPVCYISASGAHATLGFFHGECLKDTRGLLEGDGDEMRHVNIRSREEIPEKQLTAWIRQAVAFNRAPR